ncbi:MAG: ABC transporter ATP-binding protein, partial [Proteobacteria bacterium]|nr:ABC transporter ATP-binding protein [Pseudomonadota bacterium]
DLTIKSGEKIGLIGPIGSGKSTFVNIIGGLLENPKGIIEIHGLPLDHCQRDWIVKQLTMVPQKPFFFAGTFRHNLAPAGALSEATMIEALQAVELWDEIQKLPDGLNSWVGELGVNLSGGQKQRLSLARALLKPASILILDDCLSAVDSVTEAKILQNLRLRLPNQTMIWTAHRQLSLQICDRIFMMSEGQITAIESEGKYNTKLPISLKKSINYQTTIEA